MNPFKLPSKRRSNAEALARYRQGDNSEPSQDCLILEAILTPSGLPMDIEHEAIADDPVVLPAFD
ncbi:MAG: hypothetical protein VKJ09_08445, partial [Leptolyngbya sp.]|nr:hypothetical protein [Leptolyngbya sp.]